MDTNLHEWDITQNRFTRYGPVAREIKRKSLTVIPASQIRRGGKAGIQEREGENLANFLDFRVRGNDDTHLDSRVRGNDDTQIAVVAAGGCVGFFVGQNIAT